jgi:beta-lactamase regulating signal transducer with metallopeptidase domain
MSGGPAVITFTADGDAATAHGGIFALPAVWMWRLLGCYAAALVFFSGRLALRMSAAVRMPRKASDAELTPEQNQIWRDCERSFGLKGARILACAEIAGPAAIGFRTPILLLPSNFASGCTPQDFLAAIAHECAHLKRRDFQKNLFYEIASLILAFHPLIG